MFNIILPLILSLSSPDRKVIDTAPVMHNGVPSVRTTYSDGSIRIESLTGCPGCSGGYSRSNPVFLSGSRQVFDMMTVEVGDTNIEGGRRGQCYDLQNWQTCNPGTTEEDKCRLTIQAQVSAPATYVPTIWVYDYVLGYWGMNLVGERRYWTTPFFHTSQCGAAATEREYLVLVSIVPFLPTAFKFTLRARCMECEAFVR
jgi:hypothetical protein